MPRKYKFIGGDLRKIDALEKASGRAKYTDDLRLPGMLFGKLLRSTEAHAQIVSIDVSRAKALGGVRGVLTGEDLPVRYGIIPSSQDESALAIGKVRYVGEPVAAIAAIDEETAHRAADLITVVYRRLPSCLGIDDAVRGKHAPDKAIAYDFGEKPGGKPAYVREDLFFYEGSTHLALEEHSALAVWKDGKLTLRCSSQTPFHLRKIACGLSFLRWGEVSAASSIRSRTTSAPRSLASGPAGR